jgi:hypothetical protein
MFITSADPVQLGIEIYGPNAENDPRPRFDPTL